MAHQRRNRKYKCSLFPVIREDVLSLQDVKQQAGWNITAFNLPDAWRYTAGDGVKVAVIDSGCDLHHPDLKNNLLPGINILQSNLPPEDDNQHGTHVTGIICAENNDIGVVGVAPKAKVIPIKVLDKNGNGSLLAVSQGIRWAVDHGADMLVMSLGSPNKVQEVRKALQYAESKGIPAFVAAGNSGFTPDVFFPAAYPETIAVGSIDENFDRSKFSCTGKNLDFMAPGNKILSTVPKSWYAILSGTSMACPFVAGMAALVLSYARQHKFNMPLRSVEDYRNVFRKYTMPITDRILENKNFYQGFGVIDPRQFMKLFEQQKPL